MPGHHLTEKMDLRWVDKNPIAEAKRLTHKTCGNF